ncbi:hypothetical protein K438DRAFT_1759622 [Mycena galopus ATCC 62051]|nr:hypothetical protein K438DRAFT_1759622 [Mycena galopus ATCC 62051]
MNPHLSGNGSSLAKMVPHTQPFQPLAIGLRMQNQPLDGSNGWLFFTPHAFGLNFVSGKDITCLMNNWVTKLLRPLVEFMFVKIYLGNGTPEPHENETIWNVPLAILTIDEDGKDREKTFATDTKRTFKLNAGTNRFSERLAKIATEAAKEASLFSFIE